MTLKQRVVAVNWKKWLRNAAIFLAPAFLLALTALQQDASVDEVLWIVRLWLLNTLVDLTRKFIATNN